MSDLVGPHGGKLDPRIVSEDERGEARRRAEEEARAARARLELELQGRG